MALQWGKNINYWTQWDLLRSVWSGQHQLMQQLLSATMAAYGVCHPGLAWWGEKNMCAGGASPTLCFMEPASSSPQKLLEQSRAGGPACVRFILSLTVLLDARWGEGEESGTGLLQWVAMWSQREDWERWTPSERGALGLAPACSFSPFPVTHHTAAPLVLSQFL